MLLSADVAVRLNAAKAVLTATKGQHTGGTDAAIRVEWVGGGPGAAA